MALRRGLDKPTVLRVVPSPPPILPPPPPLRIYFVFHKYFTSHSHSNSQQNVVVCTVLT